MQKRKPPHATRICDDGLALDEPAAIPAATATSPSPFGTDDWAARQRVRTVVRELRRPNPATANSLNRIATDRRRLDPPHDLFGQLENATAPGLAALTSPPAANGSRQNRRSDGSQMLAWFIVVVGILTLASGIGLIGWSLTTRHMQYWKLAMGLALGGQGTLILGLALLISHLWRSSRHTLAKLQEVHGRLGQVQQATESYAANRTAGAPAFYADLVRSASPHILLANLKGQVDQLATHVGR